jgi:hypothetical protein
MKSWSFAVVGLACLIVAGCRADPNIALLERELRLQEDEIYRLRGAVADYQAALRSCGESAVPRGRSKTSEPARGGVPELPQPEGVPSPLEETKPSPQGTYGNRGSEAPPSPYKGSSGLPPGSGKPNGPSGKAPVERPNGLKRPVPNPSGDKGLGDGMRVQPTGGMEPVLPADSRHVCQVVATTATGGPATRESRWSSNPVMPMGAQSGPPPTCRWWCSIPRWKARPPGWRGGMFRRQRLLPNSGTGAQMGPSDWRCPGRAIRRCTASSTCLFATPPATAGSCRRRGRSRSPWRGNRAGVGCPPSRPPRHPKRAGRQTSAGLTRPSPARSAGRLRSGLPRPSRPRQSADRPSRSSGRRSGRRIGRRQRGCGERGGDASPLGVLKRSIWTQELRPIEMNHVVGMLRNPDFGFPSDVRRVFPKVACG